MGGLVGYCCGDDCCTVDASTFTAPVGTVIRGGIAGSTYTQPTVTSPISSNPYRKLRRRNKILEVKIATITRTEPEQPSRPDTHEIGGTEVNELPQMEM